MATLSEKLAAIEPDTVRAAIDKIETEERRQRGIGPFWARAGDEWVEPIDGPGRAYKRIKRRITDEEAALWAEIDAARLAARRERVRRAVTWAKGPDSGDWYAMYDGYVVARLARACIRPDRLCSWAVYYYAHIGEHVSMTSAVIDQFTELHRAQDMAAREIARRLVQ